jgi:ubiquinone/menaquinone biosynthesis C-methylase UbiE
MHGQARYYDVLAWLLTLGRERAFRDRLVQLARLEPGDSVLDIGCGTGTLAIAAKRRVGATGIVEAIDASPEMIERATRKAARAGVDVVFRTGSVEALPFPDGHFDAILSTLMLHHLPRPVREQCMSEVRRVLKPGGRVLAVDFAIPARERTGVLARLHRHGHLALHDIEELLTASGLRVVESGAVGVSDLQFAFAIAPTGAEADRGSPPRHVMRSLVPLRAPGWLLPAIALGVIALIAAHAVLFRSFTSALASSAVIALAIAIVLALVHLRVGRVIHALLATLRRRSR